MLVFVGMMQECDVKLMPGNLYSMQGQNLYCPSHYHDDGGDVPLPHELQPKPDLKEGGCVFTAAPLHSFIKLTDRFI